MSSPGLKDGTGRSTTPTPGRSTTPTAGGSNGVRKSQGTLERQQSLRDDAEVSRAALAT